MKQPKVQIPDPLPPVFAVSGPRYRYFSEPPSVVTLRVGDLLAEVPDAVRVLGCDESHMLELSAEEIFQGAVPKISVGRLAEIAPDCFRVGEQADLQIRLPVARLALSYRPVIGKELLEEVPPPAPPMLEIIEAEFAPLVTEPEASDLPEEKETPEVMETPEAFEEKSGLEKTDAPEEKKDEEKKEPAPLAEISPVIDSLAKAEIAAPIEPPPFTPPITPPPAPVESAITEPIEIAPLPPPAPPVKEEAILPPPPPTPAAPPQPRGNLFSMLPIFRRKAPEPAPEPEKPRRARIELPPPRIPTEALRTMDVEKPTTPEVAVVPPELEKKIEEPMVAESTPPAEIIGAKVEEPKAEAVPADLPKPPVITPEPPAISSALLVETEHLPKETPRQAEGEIVDHDGLQALFLTEEFLTVDRVVELCGGLPGINSCVLSHGAAVISSHNVPDSIDLVSLSAHALDMLRAMRESSAKMGIGAVPAVTIHSEKGPITFFHQEDICLLVLHKDKGFVPGVREKLQSVVSELTKTRLTKTLGSAPQRTIEG